MLDSLKAALGEAYTPEIEKTITAEIGKTFVPRTEFNAANEAKKTLDAQLQEATATIESIKAKSEDAEAIKAVADEWKTKAEQIQAEAAKKVTEADYRAAAVESIAGIQFSSNSAKKAFLEELKAKALPLENGKIMGFDDFHKAYKENDPDAFKSSETTPKFTAPSNGQAPIDEVRAALGLK